MNPYEADPTKIPPTDKYANNPQYGRYISSANDIVPFVEKGVTREDKLRNLWNDIVDLCPEHRRIKEGSEGTRDVFALANTIIKSNHLHRRLDADDLSRDLSFTDYNEVQATALARGGLKVVKVPTIYFVESLGLRRHVMIQERIPGVGLDVAWPYLSITQKQKFKEDARNIIRDLSKIQPDFTVRGPNYVVKDDSYPEYNRGLWDFEREMLFENYNHDRDICFMHNDLTTSNIIVDDDKIVGIIGWKMAGFFGLEAAAQIHAQVRCPQRKDLAALNLSEEEMNDRLFWNDLYDGLGTDRTDSS